MKKILRFSMFGLFSLLFATSNAQNPQNYTGLPFTARTNINIPGSIPAWMFDSVPSGNGTNITYATMESTRQGCDKNGFNSKAIRPNETESLDGGNDNFCEFQYLQVGWFHAGTSWVRYTYNVPAEGDYSLKFQYRSGAVAAYPDSIIAQFDFGGTDQNSPSDAVIKRQLVFTAGGWTVPSGPDTLLVNSVHLLQGKHVLTLSNAGTGLNDPCDFNPIKITFGAAVGINNFNKNNLNVEVYPLPCKASLNVSMNNKNKTSNIMITDITGKQVFNSNYSNQNLINVNTSNLVNGVYFITIKNNDGIATKKFIKM